MSRKHLYILTGLLTGIALVVFAYRILVLEFPLVPTDTTETWRIEARIQFEARGGPAKVTLMIPRNTAGLTLIDQGFVSAGYGLVTSSPGVNRRAIFSSRSASGRQVLYYRAVVHRSRAREPVQRARDPVVERTRFSGANESAARSIVETVQRQAADTETFVRLLIGRLLTAKAGSDEAFILHANPSTQKIVNTAVQLLGLANIPARSVHGLALDPDRRTAQIGHWLEIVVDDVWRPYDTGLQEFGTPRNHLPWWRGNAPLTTVEGGRDPHTEISVRRILESSIRTALDSAREKRDPLIDFSFFSLPLQTQEVYRTLLVVPIGIFLLVILRNVVGIKTFGTFMPVLIALALREAELLWGLILFGAVLGIGLAVRFYLEQLKLLLVPRLASVVIVVIITMAFLSLLSHKLGFDRGLSVALFPIVILAMTIERMTIVWDERGPREAFQQAGGSLLVAVLCYLLMNLAYVRYLVFVFPETLLVFLAGALLLGRYSGYRLVELTRFKVLAEKP